VGPGSARLDVTIVCYAGPDQLPHMLHALVSHGRPSDDSAVLIYNGTLPSQETTLGTLDEIMQRVKQSNDRRAAILVVGRVTALREHLRWFDSRPLFGKRILVTRPREQAAEFVALLDAWAAQPIEAPMISIAPPADWGPLDEVCRRGGEFDWIVFSSAHAVDAFIGRLLASPLDVRSLKGAKFCVVGPATGDRLARYGLKVDLVPDESRAEAVVRAMVEAGFAAGNEGLVPA